MALFDAATADRFAAGAIRPIAFFVVKTHTGPWLRAWTGFGDRRVVADAVDTDGGLYTGIGLLVGFPVLGQLMNGTFERVEFTLSGVDARALALTGAGAAAVKGAPCSVGITALDANWSQIAAPFWLWDGDADVVRRRIGARRRSIGLSIGTVGTGRRRPPLEFLTGPAQRRRHPGDAAADGVSRYPVGSSEVWPA